MLLHGYNTSDGSFIGTSVFSNPVMEEAQKGDSITVDEFDFVEGQKLYKSDGVTFSLIDGWEIIKAADDALTASLLEDANAASVRSERDALLAGTDWTGTSDLVMTSAMTAYRQALRDVPAQADFPTTITWPDAP